MDARPVDPTRLSRRKWYGMVGGWSVLLVPWLVEAATGPIDPPWLRVAVVASVIVLGLGYVQGLYLGITGRLGPRAVAALLVAMTASWLAMLATLGDGASVLYTVSYLVVALVALLRPPLGVLAAAAACATGLAVVWERTGAIELDEVVPLVAICAAMAGTFGLIRANAKLRDAREELAVLAVAGERERIARDLHDVLGHSLTSITVKAALARRLLESGDATRAAEEVGDVERLGRQALADVRATVAANRVTSLPAELAGAREALRAAGIEAELPGAVDDVPPERQQVFAFVVREGVTNVIRHSRASRCTVRLAPDAVEVLDDGVGSPAPVGHGLTGLAERLAAIGGRLDAGPSPAGGYLLRGAVAP